MTERIQRKRIKGWRAPEGTLNITRPGRYGNPYPVKLYGREKAIAMFEQNLSMMKVFQPKRYRELLEQVRRAKYIMCFCTVDQPCHGDVWLRRAEEVVPMK